MQEAAECRFEQKPSGSGAISVAKHIAKQLYCHNDHCLGKDSCSAKMEFSEKWNSELLLKTFLIYLHYFYPTFLPQRLKLNTEA